MTFSRDGLRVFALLAIAPVLCAQTDRGTITGTVVDPGGGAVANVSIEIRNTQTGVSYSAATSATGNYTFSQLPIGIYRLTLPATGFKTYIIENLPLTALQTLRLDIALEIGTAAESVTVNAVATMLKTESAEVSYNISGDRLISLPLLPIGNGYASPHGVRNPLSVAYLVPGVYFDPASLNVRVHGMPSNTEAVRIDGQDATNGLVPFAQSQTQPSVEALEELTIQTSNYAAEFGQAGGGIFNYTAKSGANRWRGSLYNYLSNEFLNAAQSFKKDKLTQRRNDYGGTLGGPVRIPRIYDGRDRTFFFWGYEAFSEYGVASGQSPTVPTEAYRNGDFSAALSGRPITGNPADANGQIARDGQIFDPVSQVLAADGRRIRSPFPSNVIPVSRFDPSAAKVLALIPKPTNGALVQNYNNPFRTDRFTSIPSLKLDHSLSARQKLSFYWSTTGTATQYCTQACQSEGFPIPITATTGTFINSYTLRLNYDYTVTPALLLHLGAGFLNVDLKGRSPGGNFDTAAVLGIAGATAGPENNGGYFPAFTGMTATNGGMNNMGPGGGQHNVEQKPTYNASFTWVKGNHTYKWGGEFRTEGIILYSTVNTNGRFAFSAAETGNPWFSDAGVQINGGTPGFPFASLLLGRVNQAQLAAFATTRGGRKYLGFYAQDTWKATRKLTLDYGLRYDYASYAKEQYGRAPAFSPNVANSTAGGRLGGTIFEATCHCSFSRNYPHGWGPRVGVAYQWNDKTVIRAGFGVSYAAVAAAIPQPPAGANVTSSPAAVGDAAMILSQGFPLHPIWPDLRANLFPDPISFGGQPFVFDQNSGRPARQLQWSAGVQREFIRGLVAEVSYIGNRGVWWRTGALAPYNVLSPDILSRNGLDITNAGDRTILASQLNQPQAQRFFGRLPFPGALPSFSVARSLTDFPQFANALVGPGPLGKTWYDSLQVRVTKRLSRGLDLRYSYTFSKELQLGAENDTGGGLVNDILNRDANEQLSLFSRPHLQSIALAYTLPRWGRRKWLNHVVADWTISGVFQYSSGQPIPIPGTALPTSNLGQALLRPTRAERVPGVPLFLRDLNCHCFDPGQTQVLNPAAWKDPVAGTFTPSAAYYNDYRYQRRPRESVAFGRIFRMTERVQLLVRAEFHNAFNRTQTPNPIVTGYTTGISKTTASIAGGAAQVSVNNAGFGVIATQPAVAVGGERYGLLVGRVTF